MRSLADSAESSSSTALPSKMCPWHRRLGKQQRQTEQTDEGETAPQYNDAAKLCREGADAGSKELLKRWFTMKNGTPIFSRSSNTPSRKRGIGDYPIAAIVERKMNLLPGNARLPRRDAQRTLANRSRYPRATITWLRWGCG